MTTSERGGTVDAAALKSAGLDHAGSSPAARTTLNGGICMDDKPVSQPTTKPIPMIEEAVEAGIEAAAEYVSAQPAGADKSWGSKEFRIAETAAREAIAALRQAEAGK